MDTSLRPAKYISDLLSSVNELRKRSLLCDFIIKVQDVLYPVHRIVLSAACRFFSAHFSRNPKSDAIELNQLDVFGVTQCIEYIYSGKIMISCETVREILKVSECFGMPKLSNECFDFILDNLKETCFVAVHLAAEYDRRTVGETAEQYIKQWSLTASFQSVPISELTLYMEASRGDYKSLWGIFDKWMGQKSEETYPVLELRKLLKAIKVPNFPFNFLLENVLTRKNFTSTIDFILNEIQLTTKQVFEGLSEDNCFTLLALCRQEQMFCKLVLKETLIKYMNENFGKLARNKLLAGLDEKDMYNLLQSSDPAHTSEEDKLQAILSWGLMTDDALKYYFSYEYKVHMATTEYGEFEQKRRKNVLPTLLGTLKADQLSPKILCKAIKNKRLQKTCETFWNSLIDELCTRAENRNPQQFTHASNVSNEEDSVQSCEKDDRHLVPFGILEPRAQRRNARLVESDTEGMLNSDSQSSCSSSALSFVTMSVPSDRSGESEDTELGESGISSNGRSDDSPDEQYMHLSWGQNLSFNIDN